MSNIFIEDLKRFISIRSTADNKEDLRASIDFVDEYFNGVSVHKKHFEYDNIPSIVVGTHEGSDFDVILNGHSDVVAAPTELFSLVERDDILIGRGTADMKAFVLAMMSVMKELVEKKMIRYRLGLMVTADEEIGGHCGVRHLLQDLGYTCAVAHIPDGGKCCNTVEVANKGYMRFHCVAHGKAAHGSRPWLGKNAIDMLIGTVSDIRGLFETPDPNFWRATCNLSILNGGKTFNAVPDYAEAYLDVRYTINEDPESLYAEMKKIGDSHGVSIDRTGFGATFDIDVKNPYFKLYEDSIRRFTQSDIVYYRSEGASDARYFAEKKIPIIVHQANCDGLHTNDEWLSKSSLDAYMNILREWLIGMNDKF